jgi:hypothetical protein
MVLSVSISSETEIKLKAKAAIAGMDVQTFAARALEREASRPLLDELLAPLRAELDSSGMSEEELANLLETAKHRMRSERQGRKAS